MFTCDSISINAASLSSSPTQLLHLTFVISMHASTYHCRPRSEKTNVSFHLPPAIINMCDKMRKSFFLILRLFFSFSSLSHRLLVTVKMFLHISNSMVRCGTDRNLFRTHVCNRNVRTLTQVSVSRMKSSELNYTGKI